MQGSTLAYQSCTSKHEIEGKMLDDAARVLSMAYIITVVVYVLPPLVPHRHNTHTHIHIEL